MKPKTKIQKEVARLSANFSPISATQIEWAYRHCVEHIGYRTKKGNITCSDCGHEWHSDSTLCDTLEGCVCPKCHTGLKVQDTRKRTYWKSHATLTPLAKQDGSLWLQYD